MKKLLKSKIEAGNKVKEVRKVVKTYETQKQDMYDNTAEIRKPSIDVQKSIKKTIDEKQNELIDQLKENDEIGNIKQNQIIPKLQKNNSIQDEIIAKLEKKSGNTNQSHGR